MYLGKNGNILFFLSQAKLAAAVGDRVFEPLLAADGGFSDSVAQIIGVGVGRVIGLLSIVLGFIILLSTLAAFLYPRLKHVETELPDYVADKSPGTLPG